MGWTYWDLMALPWDVYEVLIDQLRKESDHNRTAA